MYFIDKEHENNFLETLVRFPNAKNNSEYKSACYILAVPMIFNKFQSNLGELESPISWILQWENQFKLTDEEKIFENYEPPKFDLTNSMVQLGKLAFNLWNGYDDFNLLDCISKLDAAHYPVVKTAMDIRMKVI